MASILEDSFLLQLEALGLTDGLVRDYRFCQRKWCFDFAWPDRMLAVEVDGGTYIYGRHNSPVGFRKDCEKLNTAALLGWLVLRGDSGMVKKGELVRYVKMGLSVTI